MTQGTPYTKADEEAVREELAAAKRRRAMADVQALANVWVVNRNVWDLPPDVRRLLMEAFVAGWRAAQDAELEAEVAEARATVARHQAGRGQDGRTG